MVAAKLAALEKLSAPRVQARSPPRTRRRYRQRRGTRSRRLSGAVRHSTRCRRREIDRQLVAAGWVVQDYGDLNTAAGIGVAVREFRLSTGFADYLLYVDGKIVGVIEAKREGTALIGVEQQTARAKYSVGLRRRISSPPGDVTNRCRSVRIHWCGNPVHQPPRPETALTRCVHLAKPETVRSWMQQADERPDAPTFRARLQHLPTLDPKGLRPNQIQAVTGIEKSLKDNRPRGLVQMATGAGKTFTAVTASYRLIKHAGAARSCSSSTATIWASRHRPSSTTMCRSTTAAVSARSTTCSASPGNTVLGSTNVAISTIQRLYGLLRARSSRRRCRMTTRTDETFEPESPVDVVHNVNVNATGDVRSGHRRRMSPGPSTAAGVRCSTISTHRSSSA